MSGEPQRKPRRDTRDGRLRADRTFDLLSFEALLERPDRSWLIEGLVPAGLTVLSGPSGAGHSFVALDWALHVATGLAWPGHHIVEQGAVVYLASHRRTEVGARALAWCLAHGQPDLSRIHWLLDTVNLRDHVQLDRARRTLAALQEPPALLVVDTMARVMGGGVGRSAPDISEFVAALDALRAEGSALVVHDTREDGEAESDPSSLQQAADLIVKVEPGSGHRLTLKCQAMRGGETWPAIGVYLKPAHGSAVVSRSVERAAARDGLREKVLAHVTDHAPISGTRVASEVGGRKREVLEALRELAASGMIGPSPSGWAPVPMTGEPARNRIDPAPGDGDSVRGDPNGSPEPERPPADSASRGVADFPRRRGKPLTQDEFVAALVADFNATLLEPGEALWPASRF